MLTERAPRKFGTTQRRFNASVLMKGVDARGARPQVYVNIVYHSPGLAVVFLPTVACLNSAYRRSFTSLPGFGAAATLLTASSNAADAKPRDEAVGARSVTPRTRERSDAAREDPSGGAVENARAARDGRTTEQVRVGATRGGAEAALPAARVMARFMVETEE